MSLTQLPSTVKFEPALAPMWAIGTADDYQAIGAQLCTRDGRKVGNAVVVGNTEMFGTKVSNIRTDVGTEMHLNLLELQELFHKPMFLMHVETHPGVMRATLLQAVKPVQPIEPVAYGIADITTGQIVCVLIVGKDDEGIAEYPPELLIPLTGPANCVDAKPGATA